MFLLAYGEFQTDTYWGAFGEVLPHFLGWIIPPALSYISCSFVVKHISIRGVGVLAYLLVFAMFAPFMVVMGAYGPAHVAMEMGIWAWPAFFVLICIRTVKPLISDSQKTRADKQLQLNGVTPSKKINVH